jgi:ATP-dependent DNA helicase RecG
VDLAPCEGASLEDLDPTLVDAYRQELLRRRPNSPQIQQPVTELLLGIGAAVKVKSQLCPTLTGMLFFGRDPQRFYPGLSITFVHFSGTTTTVDESGGRLYLDNREFTGVIPILLESARAAVYEKLSKRAVLRGFVRQDVPEYPEFAYREAIVNAVSHRDYDLEGSSIQVRLFADRLEVQSPGGLGGNLTVENIVYEQYTRNPHIVRLMEDMGYVERRGLGVDHMIRSMEVAGLKPPRFEDRGSSFWVTLQAEQPVRPMPELIELGLNERQIQSLALFQSRGRLTNREYQQAFDVSERTALYDLQGLVEAGLALPVSSGRGRYYIIRD